MKKIGILTFANKHAGGVYQYTQSIIDALKKDAEKEYIIFCNCDDNRFDNYELDIRKIGDHKNNFFLKVVRHFQLFFFIRKAYFFTPKELEMFNDIDIFISPTISAYPHFYMDKPFIITLHDMQERYYPEFFSKTQRITRWLKIHSLAKSSNKIICESNAVKNDIVKFTGIDKKKISLIQSPPPEKLLNYKFNNEQLQKVKNKYNLPEKFIFYPAQCWFHKNHIKLIEAFELVSKQRPDVYLILIGSQQNNYNNLIKKIDELGLNSRIKHLGYIDYKYLPLLYKTSQFLVMPTLFESVSIPIYEAFSLEVAVCCSNVVALPEQIGDAGLLFDPNNINDMAEKMMVYLKSESLRKEKAKMGFDKVINFNHEEYKQKLTEIL